MSFSSDLPTVINGTNTKKRIGRPVGSSNDKKRKETEKEKSAKHDIICNYMWEITNSNTLNVHKKDIFKNVFEETRHRYELMDTFSFPYRTALSRIHRNNFMGNGRDSPLYPVEREIVNLILSMSKLKMALTVSECICLINELIADTPIQQRLKEWKLSKHTPYKDIEDLGKVGQSYWGNFLKRHKHELKSKVGKKFSVDRSNWTSYLNFRDMLLSIKDVMVNDSKIASKLPNPVWVDRDGHVVADEKDAFGCKTDIRIDRPDMVIMFDEVGNNLSQEGDNANGGERYLCAPNEVPYQSSATKNNHFTNIGVTRMDGHPLMCVTIIAGKKRDLSVETGIEWEKIDHIDDTYLDEVDDYVFVKDNFGEDKLLPGGPSCFYKGVEVPAFTTFTESGGIDGWTLREIFRRIDDLQLYENDRKRGYTPFCLLDGHQSRFDLNFLQYINNPSTKWNVCLGVPYGTSLWQVGDSSEQNGTFKMSMANEKKKLFKSRISCFQQSMHLVRTDIMGLVMKTWPKAFANVENNQKAICDRGYSPFTMALLLNPILRATMTEEMITWERESGLFPSWAIEEKRTVQYVENAGAVILKSISCSHTGFNNLNFDRGAMAQHVADTILGEVDRQKARERVQKRKREGDTRRNRILKIQKKLTAGRLVLDGRSYHLDHSVLDHVERRRAEQLQESVEKNKKEQLEYMKMCYHGDRILDVYGGNMDVKKWKKKEDIITYLKPLKRSGDPGLTMNRATAEERFQEWKDHERRSIDADDEVVQLFESWKRDYEHKDDENESEDAQE